MNTVLFVNASIGFSENLYLVNSVSVQAFFSPSEQSRFSVPVNSRDLLLWKMDYNA